MRDAIAISPVARARSIFATIADGAQKASSWWSSAKSEAKDLKGKADAELASTTGKRY